MPDAPPAPQPKIRFFITDLVALLLLVMLHLAFAFGIFVDRSDPGKAFVAAGAVTFSAIVGWYVSIRMWSRFNPPQRYASTIPPQVSMLERIAHSIAYEILVVVAAPFLLFFVFLGFALLLSFPVLLFVAPLCACMVIAAKRSDERKTTVSQTDCEYFI